MQIIRQQNAIKSHFSIIPYGITMSKIFRCLFSVPHLHYLFAFIPVGRNDYFFLCSSLGLVSVISRSSVGGTLGTLPCVLIFIFV